jgi:hypothetical protein
LEDGLVKGRKYLDVCRAEWQDMKLVLKVVEEALSIEKTKVRGRRERRSEKCH